MCFICVVAIAWLQRLVRRVALVRAVTTRAGREWLLNAEDPSAGAPAAVAVRDVWRRQQLRSLGLLVGIDLASLLLAVVGTVVFVAQINQWFATSSQPNQSGGVTSTLSMTTGAFVAAGGVGAMTLAATVSVSAGVIEWRKLRAADAAASASGPSPLMSAAAVQPSGVSETSVAV